MTKAVNLKGNHSGIVIVILFAALFICLLLLLVWVAASLNQLALGDSTLGFDSLLWNMIITLHLANLFTTLQVQLQNNK